MAVELGTGYIALVPSARGFAGRLQSEVRGAGASAGRQIGDELDKSLSSRLNGVLRGLGGFALRAGTVITAAGGALAAWGLKSAASLQQTEIAFEGIFGSASTANDFLGELRKFAAKTPFEFPELATASKQLLAVGFAAGDVIPVMTQIGNVAATLGVGADGVNSVIRALGQMKGKGKASAEELQQISEAIPGFSAIGAIAESMGISTSEAFAKMAAGAIPADQAINAILGGMERFPGAAGAMERQSQTLLGVLSTFKDTARDALVQGLAPVLPALSTSIQDAMPQLSAALTSLGTTFGKLLSALMPMLSTLLPVFAQIAGAISGMLTQAFDALGPVITALGPAFAQLASALGPLVGAIAGALGPALAVALPALIKVGAVLAKGLTPVIEALAPLVAMLGEIFALQMGNLVAIMKPLFPIIAKIASVIGGALLEQMKQLKPIIPQVGRAFAEIAKVLGGALLDVFKAIAPAIPEIAKATIALALAAVRLLVALVPIIPPLVRIGTLLVTEIGVPVLLGIAKAFTALVSAVTPLVSLLAGGLAGALNLIAGLIKPIAGLFDGLGSAVGGALKFIVGVVGDIASAIGGIPGIISGAVTAVFNAAKGIGMAIKDGIVSVLNGALSVVLDIAAAIWKMFKSAWNGLVQVINDAIPDTIPLPGLPDIQLPHNPFNFAKLATGGITTGPALALIGEGRSDEAVVPLDPFYAHMDDMLGQTSRTSGVVDSSTHVHFHGDTYGMRDFESKVASAVKGAARHGKFRGSGIVQN